MNEFGFFSKVEDGFFESGYYSLVEAMDAYETLDSETKADTEIIEICPWHDDEIARDCPKCEEEL